MAAAIAIGLGWRVLATLGVSSYEIFLVQIGWFTLVPDRGVIVIVDIVVCCALGYALHRALAHVPSVATVARSRSRRAGAAVS